MKKLLSLILFIFAITSLMAQSSANVVGYLTYQGQPLTYTTVTCQATGNNWHAPLKISTTTTDGSGYFSIQTLSGNNIISVIAPNSQKVNFPFNVSRNFYELRVDVDMM